MLVRVVARVPRAERRRDSRLQANMGYEAHYLSVNCPCILANNLGPIPGTFSSSCSD
jgi:hypothetical protein